MKNKPEAHKELLLAPMPAQIRRSAGYARLPEEICLYEEKPSVFSGTFRRELAARKETHADAATVRLLGPEPAAA